MKSYLIKFIFLFSFVLIFSKSVFAGTTGSVSGKTENALGTAIPYVMVIWVDGRGHGYRITMSDESGNFNFRDNYLNEHVEGFTRTVNYDPYSIDVPAFESRTCCPMCPGNVMTHTSVYRCIDGNQNLADYIYSKKINSYEYGDLSASIRAQVEALKVSGWTPIASNPNISNEIWSEIPNTASEVLLNEISDYLKYEKPLQDYEFLARNGDTSDFQYYPGHGPNSNFDFRTMTTVIGNWNNFYSYNCGISTHRIWWYPSNYSGTDPDRSTKNGPYKVPLNNGAYNTINLRSSNCIPSPTDRCASRCVRNEEGEVLSERLGETESSPYAVDGYSVTNGSCISRDCPGVFIPCIGPTAYPEKSLTGDLFYYNESESSNCQGEKVPWTTGTRLDLAIEQQAPNPYFSQTCTVSDPTSSNPFFNNYNCAFNLRNYYLEYYEPIMATPDGKIQLNLRSANYTTPQGSNDLMTFWGKEVSSCTYNCNQQSPLVCAEKTTRLALNFANGDLPNDIHKNIYFGNNITTSWFKLKDTSFVTMGDYSRVDNIANPPTQFADAAGLVDSDDAGTSPYVIVGEAGLLSTSLSTYELGLNPNAKYSSKDWSIKNYSAVSAFSNTDDYFAYAENASVFKKLTNWADATSSNDKFFYYTGDLVISNDNMNFFNRSRGLIIKGTVSFDLGENSKFEPSKSPIIVANNINFYTSLNVGSTSSNGLVQYAKGVFVADHIDTGIGTDIPLKIKGNLVVVSNSTIGLEMKRTRTTSGSPILFVAFDPSPYLDLFGFFPINRYEATH
jgi:hypothetical protein